MKTFKYFFATLTLIVAAVSGLSLTSCSDLDETPYTFIDPNSYYSTEAEVETALVATYNRFRRIYSGNNSLYVAHVELLTEQGWPCYTKDNMDNISKWAYANNASTGGVMKVWATAYECINRANIVLGRVEQVSMSEESRNRIKGQALFLRGYTFFHLLRLWGGVPLPLTYTNGIEGLELGRATLDETYEQAIKDIAEAEKLLPERGAANYDVWRISKGACNAALGQIYLYRASMNNNNTEYLSLSRQYSEAVIKSKKYDLMPEFTDNFYWFNANAKNNMESIFELQYSTQSGQSNNMHIRFGIGRTNNDFFGCYQYCRFGVSGFLYQEMVNNGDKRAEALLSYFNGVGDDSKVIRDHYYNAETLRWEPMITNDKGGEHMCVFNLKYFDRLTDYSLQAPNANFGILRYADVLLNYAEASNLLKAGDGIAELNRVRTRAGLPALQSTSQSEIDEDILNQRRYEFVGEAKIYYDELRKDKLADFAAAKCERGVAEGITYLSELVFKPKQNYLFLIPQGDLDGNKALEQNPENVSK
ncbi:MAG: RagB/SusD family nutrient uptake outer membrane protein [Rikenellaceae bacterium]|nr:RagB/SusD family nutrient uptake outer membrane protein [Rikenellaceae bacterium]